MSWNDETGVEGPFRWLSKISYRTNDGPNEVELYLSELNDLQEIVERGPHWDTIIKIEVNLCDPTHPGLTVEEANAL